MLPQPVAGSLETEEEKTINRQKSKKRHIFYHPFTAVKPVEQQTAVAGLLEEQQLFIPEVTSLKVALYSLGTPIVLL
jgi:predicted naringenin-chalcone synthase